MEGSRKKITTFYNQHLQQSISKQTTHQTLKQVGYASRKPNWVPLLSTEIRTIKKCSFTNKLFSFGSKCAFPDMTGFLL